MNVIPGEAEIYVDMRGIDDGTKAETTEAIRQEIKAIGAKRSIAVDIVLLTDEKPTKFSTKVIRMLETVCDELGVDALELPSGAGHDAAHLGEAIDASMIFVPSIRGISHDPREATRQEDIHLGAQILLATLLSLASY